MRSLALLKNITRARKHRFGALLTLVVFITASISPIAYADGSPCGINVPASQCPCPPSMESNDCQALIGNWTGWKPTGANPATCTTGSSGIDLAGTDNAQKVMNFFVSKGMTDFQAAGAVGNLDYESGGALDPKALEAKGSGKSGYTGHGIVQWSWERWRTDYGSGSKDVMRVPNAARLSDLTDFAPYPPKPPLDPNTLLGFAAQQGTPWYDLGTQVAFMWLEINPGGNRGKVLASMKATTTMQAAAKVWFDDYEQPGDGTLGKRIERGQKALDNYRAANGATPTTPTDTPTTPTPTPAPTTPQSGCGGGVVAGATEGDLLKVPAGGSGANVYGYGQGDARWQGQGYDFAWCGCGQTSSAIIASSLLEDPSITPVSVFGVTGDALNINTRPDCGGSNMGTLASYLRGKGLQTEYIQSRGNGGLDTEKAAAALKQGRALLVHTSRWVNITGDRRNTLGHYLVVYAVDSSGKFYVSNPGNIADNGVPISSSDISDWLDEAVAVWK